MQLVLACSNTPTYQCRTNFVNLLCDISANCSTVVMDFKRLSFAFTDSAVGSAADLQRQRAAVNLLTFADNIVRRVVFTS